MQNMCLQRVGYQGHILLCVCACFFVMIFQPDLGTPTVSPELCTNWRFPSLLWTMLGWKKWDMSYVLRAQDPGHTHLLARWYAYPVTWKIPLSIWIITLVSKSHKPQIPFVKLGFSHCNPSSWPVMKRGDSQSIIPFPPWPETRGRSATFDPQCRVHCQSSFGAGRP